MRMVSTGPLVPFVYAWIWYHAETDDRSAHKPDFLSRTVFSPEAKSAASEPEQKTSDWALLEYYTLVVVQENADNPSYEPTIDLFGQVWLEGSRDTGITPHVDTYKHSLLDENGLVLKADRPECILLRPSGLFHAGHPRQRNTQMIYFDQADFDDNQLLEKYLRLPQHAVLDK